MEEDGRRASTRLKKTSMRMAAALASEDNRTQAALARLDALENDNPVNEVVELDDDEDASLDEEEQDIFAVFNQKKQSKILKRKTRQAKALESAKKAPKSFLELLQEANLEALPPHVPTYLTAAVGTPTATVRRHFCSVCGYTAPYTCTLCGARFCSTKCQAVHSDTRCLKFVT